MSAQGSPGCGAKRVYRSERHAKADARAAKDHYGRAYAAYWCSAHRGWHVGSTDAVDRGLRRARGGSRR